MLVHRSSTCQSRVHARHVSDFSDVAPSYSAEHRTRLYEDDIVIRKKWIFASMPEFAARRSPAAVAAAPHEERTPASPLRARA